MARNENFTSAFIYSEELAGFEFSPTHPFKPFRANLTLNLCRRYDLIEKPGIRLVTPKPLDFSILAEFHDESYLKLLQAVDSRKAEAALFDPQILKYGLGTEDNPFFAGMYHFCALASGATFLGAQMVASGEVQAAFNPLGGFHHAGRGHAEGFCYINDVAVAITDLLKRGKRIAFVDIDAHHGNGVQDAFYEDDRVLFISYHENGRNLYPWSGFETEIGEGAGRGYTVNVPLPEQTDDETFVRAFAALVPELLNAYKPDLVIAEIGADMHVSDPLTHLCVTNSGYCEAIRILAACAPAILAVGGGGYDAFKTARNWTLAWAILNDLEPRDEYAGIIGGMMFGPEAEAGTLWDISVPTTGAVKELITGEVDRVIDYIRQNVFPIHNINKESAEPISR